MKNFLFFFVLSVVVKAALAGNPDGKYKTNIINNQDTVVFDLCNVVHIADTVQFPIYILSDDTVDALDFSMKFDTLKLTYVKIINLKPGYLFPTSNLAAGKILHFSSYDTGSPDYEHGTNLVSVVFTSTTGKMGMNDITPLTYLLNGDACSVKIVDTTACKVAVPEIVTERSIKVYPNPASEEAFIKFKNLENTKMNISIHDILGNKVKDVFNGMANAGDLQFKIETANLPAGIYFVNITSEKSNFTRRLIVSK